MAHVITFSTGMFDVSKEQPNPINPIAGQAVLNWIRGKLEGSGCTATEPATEDWGWYIDVQCDGCSYLVGASGEPERLPPGMDWTIQIHKIRSLKDKLTGRNKSTSDDSLLARLERVVRREPEIRGVIVDKDA